MAWSRVVELLGFEVQLGLEGIDEAIDVVLQDFSGAHDLRPIVFVDQHQVGRKRQLAVGEGVECIHDLLGVGPARGSLISISTSFSRVVADGTDFDLVFARSIFYGSG